MNAPFLQRLRALQARLAERKLRHLLVTHPPNWYYLTGFTGEDGALVVSGPGATLGTDGRFPVQGKQEARGLQIVTQKGALVPTLGEGLKKTAGRVGFDPTQITVAQLRAMRRAAG